MQKPVRSSKASCLAKEATHLRLYTVRFHLYEILEKAKQILVTRDWEWRKANYCKGVYGNFLGD